MCQFLNLFFKMFPIRIYPADSEKKINWAKWLEAKWMDVRRELAGKCREDLGNGVGRGNEWKGATLWANSPRKIGWPTHSSASIFLA